MQIAIAPDEARLDEPVTIRLTELAPGALVHPPNSMREPTW